jgi:flagellar protein FlaJ
LLSSIKFWEKPKSADSFEKVSGFDLFYELTYLSAIAAAGISRSRLFQLGSTLPCPVAAYFGRADLLSQRLGYDYARACQMVGQAVESEEMKSLLLRLAAALTSGQPEASFLGEEAQVQGETYEKEYERDLASLTKWTDAYAAITVSASLLIIINLTSSLIYQVGAGTLVGMVLAAVLTASAGAWILSRSAPKEVRVLLSPEGAGAQRVACQLAKVVPPAALVVCLVLALFGRELGQILVAGALLLLPLGLASTLAGSQIDGKDREIGPFLRSLGAMAMSTGTTITEAITRLDLISFPALKPDLDKLLWSLKAGIDPELCWNRFALETGSKLIGETVGIFSESVKMGGDSDTVAFLCAQFATKTIMLRAKRQVIASTFSWLTVVMHGAIAGLMVIIMEVIQEFTNLIETAMTVEGQEAMQALTLPVFSFNTPQMGFLHQTTIAMVLVLAVVNAVAIMATDGGHRYKVSFHLSTLLLLSGMSFLVVPSLVDKIM